MPLGAFSPLLDHLLSVVLMCQSSTQKRALVSGFRMSGRVEGVRCRSWNATGIFSKSFGGFMIALDAQGECGFSGFVAHLEAVCMSDNKF